MALGYGSLMERIAGRGHEHGRLRNDVGDLAEDEGSLFSGPSAKTWLR